MKKISMHTPNPATHNLNSDDQSNYSHLDYQEFPNQSFPIYKKPDIYKSHSQSVLNKPITQHKGLYLKMWELIQKEEIDRIRQRIRSMIFLDEPCNYQTQLHNCGTQPHNYQTQPHNYQNQTKKQKKITRISQNYIESSESRQYPSETNQLISYDLMKKAFQDEWKKREAQIRMEQRNKLQEIIKTNHPQLQVMNQFDRNMYEGHFVEPQHGLDFERESTPQSQRQYNQMLVNEYQKFPKRKKNGSIVWEFFLINEVTQTTKCKLCNVEYTKNGSNTTVMLYHVRKKHSRECVSKMLELQRREKSQKEKGERRNRKNWEIQLENSIK